MGMAATQARFLGLTARKTNIEFEGQQINQQRTCLSNESASYYSRLTALSVPTPPSTQDYSKISYTFTDGSETNTINQLIATRDISGETGIYLVNYTKKVKADSIVSNGTVIVSRVNNNPTPELTAKEGYELGEIPNVGKAHTELLINDKDTTNDKIIYFDKDGKQLVDITDGKTAKEQYDEIVKNKDKDYGYMIGHTTLRTLGSTPAADDPYYSTLTDTEKANALAMENQYIQILTEKYKDANWYVRYQKDSSTESYYPVFYNQYQVQHADYNENTNASLSTISKYVWGETLEAHEVKNAKARTEQDSTGRYINITIYETDASGAIKHDINGQPIGVSYPLVSTTSTDDNAYNDAMNQYNYDKALYDKEIQDINSKMAIIQAQDKNLELKLKQLDTERNAIEKEMEACEKVVKNNVDKTFKTFASA